MAEVEKAVDPFKEQALQVLKNLIDAATQAGEFIKGQIPLVVQELLRFHLAVDIAWMILSLGFAAAFVWLIKFGRRQVEKDKWSDWDFGVVFSGFGVAASVISFFFATIALLKITLAPRVWLIEYAADLVR